MSISLTTFYSDNDIGTGASKLNSTAQKCNAEILAGFEPTIFTHR